MQTIMSGRRQRRRYASTDADREILKKIEKYGWYLLSVHGNAPYPDFTFSIGLYEHYGHPEFVVAGLDPELSAWLLNRLGDQVRDGRAFDASNRVSGVLLNDGCVALKAIERSRYGPLFGTAIWYYGGDKFPMLQVFTPDPH
jgi:hypothetical protein